MVHRLEMRTEIIALYFRNGDCTRTAARIFNERHLQENINHSYFLSLLKKFMKIVSID